MRAPSAPPEGLLRNQAPGHQEPWERGIRRRHVRRSVLGAHPSVRARQDECHCKSGGLVVVGGWVDPEPGDVLIFVGGRQIANQKQGDLRRRSVPSPWSSPEDSGGAGPSAKVRAIQGFLCKDVCNGVFRRQCRNRRIWKQDVEGGMHVSSG